MSEIYDLNLKLLAQRVEKVLRNDEFFQSILKMNEGQFRALVYVLILSAWTDLGLKGVLELIEAKANKEA